MNQMIALFSVMDFSSGDARRRLIDAGCEIFGLYNLEGATTRQIAESAGVNQAAIAYYFGGKEGLYEAVIHHFVATKFEFIRPVLVEVQQRLGAGQATRHDALELLKRLLFAFLETVLTQGAHSTWARIVMREQMQPTPAFDFLYEQAVRRMHETVSKLMGIILGRPETEPMVVLRSHMVVGQVLIFLSGQETIKRRLSLQSYSESEVAVIKEALSEQLSLLGAEIRKRA
jgi:TetR/AcrR family transcriptional regulator, regulator of cefoperazone and chloramphenicol sensitivity